MAQSMPKIMMENTTAVVPLVEEVAKSVTIEDLRQVDHFTNRYLRNITEKGIQNSFLAF